MKLKPNMPTHSRRSLDFKNEQGLFPKFPIMKYIVFFAGLFIAASLSAQVAPFVENELVVKIKQGQEIDNPVLSALHKKYGFQNAAELFGPSSKSKEEAFSRFLEGVYVLKFENNIEVLSAVKEYAATSIFEYVEPNYSGSGAGVEMECPPQIVPNEPLFSRQWGLVNNGNFSLDASKMDADIDMDLAWELEQGDSNITIAVLDSGFKLDHPELSGRIWKNHLEIPGNGIDDDSNGYVDDVQGWDFVNNDNDPTDDHGHGTNVAGIAAATGNNSAGYAGVDWNAKVMILKILDNQNFGNYTNWALAIRYAADNGANIFNMSVGGSGFSQLMESAIQYANTKNAIVVACMMNTNTSVPYYPAAYAETIAVGSTDADDTRTNPFFWSNTSGSNYGSHIDLVAPGNYIYGLSSTSNTNFGSYWGGTSQATPLVVGVGALLLAQNPNLTTEDMRNILRNTADDQVGNSQEDTPGFDNYYGAGRLNAYQALSAVSNTKGPVAGEGNFVVFPNPVNAKSAGIKFQTPENFREDFQMEISDMGGKNVFSKKVKHSGTHFFEIPVSLPPGFYAVRLVSGQMILTSKFIVK